MGNDNSRGPNVVFGRDLSNGRASPNIILVAICIRRTHGVRGINLYMRKAKKKTEILIIVINEIFYFVPLFFFFSVYPCYRHYDILMDHRAVYIFIYYNI